MAQKPVPKTKEELIAMLKEQLDKVQDDISQMQATLEEQREKRKQLTQQLQEKEQKVQELIENQTKTLGDKVNEGLFNTLQAANRIRAEAQADIRKFVEDNSILNEKITHKDNKVNEQRKTIELNLKKLSVLEQKRTDANRKEAALLNKKEEVKKNYEMMKKQYERIEKQEQQLRTNIQNAKKLRMYLNKHLEGTLKSSTNQLPPTNKKHSVQQPSDSFWNN